MKVENLSNYKPNESETSIKGLVFSPKPVSNYINLALDVIEFAKDVTIKYYCSKEKSNVNNENPKRLMKFKDISDWQTPPPLDRKNASDPNFARDLSKTWNIFFGEQKSIKSLTNNKDILILQSDKSNSTFILNTKDCISEVRNQLIDVSTYKLLEKDPPPTLNEEIREFFT